MNGLLHRPARRENVPQLLEFVSRSAAEAGFGEDKVGRIRLAAEEVLINIVTHAYPNEDGEVLVACSVHDGYFEVAVSDRGIAFNPLNTPAPPMPDNIADRRIGGLGIHLVRQLTDDVRYRREQDANHLQLFFSKPLPVDP